MVSGLMATFYPMEIRVWRCSFCLSIRASWPVLASPSARLSLDALLAHLFASRFAHTFVYRLLRKRFPMTLPRGVDWSPTGARCRGGCLFRAPVGDQSTPRGS